MRQVNGHAVGVVGHEGAALAALLPAGGQHELLHDELRATIEQIGELLAAIWSLKNVILFDRDPGQLSAQPGDLVAAPRQVLLGSEQIEPRFQPFLACYDRMGRHSLSPFAVCGADRFVRRLAGR